MNTVYFFLLNVLLIGLPACQQNSLPKEAKVREVPHDSFHSPNPIYPLWISHDYGASWQNASGDLPNDVQVSFLEQMGEEIVLATDNQGLWISQDSKSRWETIGEELPNPKLNALHIAGEDIFVSVYKEGIYHSSDEGVSWHSLNHTLPNLNIQVIYTYESYLFAGTDIGIYKTLKGGSSWEEVHSSSQVLSIYAYGEKLIAGTSQGTLLSEDGGNNWTWIRQEGAVHYTHNIDQRIYELVLNGDLAFSDDWGKSWSDTYYQPRQGSYIYEIVQVDNYLLMSNNYGIHRSENGGLSWSLIYPTEEMGFFDFLVIGNTVYGGTRKWDEYRKRNR